MKFSKYKIIISGNGIYREYTINESDDNSIKVGTKKGCHIRFQKDSFFNDFDFEISRSNGSWSMISNGSVYYTTDGIIKLYNKSLIHGDEVVVKNAEYNQEIFKVSFFIDFDMVEKKYDREIDIKGKKEITIGGENTANIFLKDELLRESSVVLEYHNGKYFIKDISGRFGVYINARKASKKEELKENDFLVIVGYYFYLKNNKLYTEVDDTTEFIGIGFKDAKSKNKFEYPKFNRNSRVRYKELSEGVEILPPERLGKKPKNKIIMTLIPAFVTLALTIVLRGIMGGGGTFVIFSVCTMSLGIVMSIVTAITTQREYKKDVEDRREEYLKYIEMKEKNILEIRKKEFEVANKIYIAKEEIIENIKSFDKNLFDRGKQDKDYLNIRLGTGALVANCETKITKEEFKNTKDDLVDIPEQILEKYKNIDNMPIILELMEMDAIGFIGTDTSIKDVVTNMTIDIIGRHFYKDVKLFYMIDENGTKEFEWLRWLKHVKNDDLDIRNIVCDEDSKSVIFEYLYVELLRREKVVNGKEKYVGQDFIVFILDSKGIYNHPISRFIEKGITLGITFIFFENYEELLPQGCNRIIKLQENNSGVMINCEDGEEKYNFKYNQESSDYLEDLAIKLASVYVDEVTLENELTKNISLYELLQIQAAEDLDIQKRWDTSTVYKSMAAPLGVKKKGERVYLDLNEKNHGPHGLVAGTTGSGKSEILQSYILSAASLYHPYEVAFVIIDFKGGGMVNQFKDLPHLVGAITNIDGREITRSLLSIKAELRKRQELFLEANVNHVDKYIQKFKAGEVKIPLPHLILIVDEFAELKSDQPEFMKELISAARIGRSLGVHLILATQKPSGVIDDQIWSNSKFKLCLKVQNQADSNEVLKSPLAAEIKEPGRAYLQVGNNEVFELFQSAYSGAPAVYNEMSNQKEFEINEINLWGKRKTVFKQVKKKVEGNAETQLEVLVQYIGDYCIENKIERMPGICLPPLSEMIVMPERNTCEKSEIYIEVELGIYDDPSRQLQDVVKLNLSENNLFIVGSSQFGKTSLMQTIIKGIAREYTPEEVNIYILDFASMILKSFENLKHVGGVVVASNDEKMKTFIKMMKEEVELRKVKLSKLGISSFTSYKEGGYTDLPQIVICVDNITALRETYLPLEPELLNLCREGIAVGITIIFANQQTAGIGYKYMSNFGNKIVLTCNDAGEYTSVFSRCRMSPKNVPGRALIEIDKVVYEYQNYLAFSGQKEIERVREMKAFIDEINSKYPNQRAKIIPEIPEVLDITHIKENYKGNHQGYKVPIGLNFEGVRLETLDLTKLGIFTTMAKIEKGTSMFIKNILDRLEENEMENPVELYVIDDIDKNLDFTNDYGFMESYSPLYNDLETVIEDVYDKLQQRNEDVLSDGVNILEDEPLIIIINNNREAIKTISTNKVLVEKFKEINSKFKNLKILTIFANVENTQVSFNAAEFMKIIKENKKSIIFDNLQDVKTFDLPTGAARKYVKPLETGEGYLLLDGEVKKIKIIEK